MRKLVWYCAVHIDDGVLVTTPRLPEAQNALNKYGNAKEDRAVIPMKKFHADDPHSVAKQWSGGSAWWSGKGGIDRMRALCSRVIRAPVFDVAEGI